MISCALIGLGQIGFRYDLNGNSKHSKLTHFTTMKSLPGFHFEFAVEIDSRKSRLFEDLTGMKSYESINLLPRHILSQGIDLLVIATPANVHLQTLTESLALRPKVVLLEKPLALSREDAEQIVNIAAKYGVKLFVNYQRNYIPAFRQLKELIGTSQESQEYSLVAWLQGDLLTNGSHMFALIDFLFPGYLRNLTSLDEFGMHFEKSGSLLNLNLSNVGHLKASKFSLEITSFEENYRYDSNLEEIAISHLDVDKVYFGQRTLQKPSQRLQTHENDCLKFVYSEISNYLSNRPYYSYSGEDAFFIMQFVSQVLNSPLGDF